MPKEPVAVIEAACVAYAGSLDDWNRYPSGVRSAALRNMADALAAADAARWQPIETAPKTGHPVLLINDRGQFVARWTGRDPYDSTIFPEHWVVSCGKHNYNLRGGNPTHWKPLPEPPADADAR